MPPPPQNRYINGTLTFNCQFGVEDCNKSRVQLCVLDDLEYYYGQEEVMEFIACQMAFSSDLTGETVSSQVHHLVSQSQSQSLSGRQ